MLLCHGWLTCLCRTPGAGTHNSGNTLELSTEPLYPPDANYGKYVEWARGRGLEPLGEEQFHRRFLPWNTNHHADLMEQLRNGIRWFHLKVRERSDCISGMWLCAACIVELRCRQGRVGASVAASHVWYPPRCRSH